MPRPDPDRAHIGPYVPAAPLVERGASEDEVRTAVKMQLGKKGRPRKAWDHFVTEDGSPVAALIAWSFFEHGGRKMAALRAIGYSPRYAYEKCDVVFGHKDVQRAIARVRDELLMDGEVAAREVAQFYLDVLRVTPGEFVDVDGHGQLTAGQYLDLTPRQRRAIKSIKRRVVTFEGDVTEEWYEVEWESRPEAAKGLRDLLGLDAATRNEAEGMDKLVDMIRSATGQAARQAERPALEDVDWREVTEVDDADQE